MLVSILMIYLIDQIMEVWKFLFVLLGNLLDLLNWWFVKITWMHKNGRLCCVWVSAFNYHVAQYGKSNDRKY